MHRQVLSIVVGAAALLWAGTACAADDAVVTDPATGNDIVTLSDGAVETVPAAIVSEIAAAMATNSPAIITRTVAEIVEETAPHNADLATAIYFVALRDTSTPALQAAAYAGAVAGDPAAANVIAENQPPHNGPVPVNAVGPGSVAGPFPVGGTSGGGSTPSADVP